MIMSGFHVFILLAFNVSRERLAARFEESNLRILWKSDFAALKSSSFSPRSIRARPRRYRALIFLSSHLSRISDVQEIVVS
jgi:hypothetical protein